MTTTNLEALRSNLMAQREQFLKEANERLAFINGQMAMLDDLLKQAAEPEPVEERWDSEQ